MSRPLRIEFPGAVFHVTSRGDRREPIYRDDADRVIQLAVLDEATSRFDAAVLAYCLMGWVSAFVEHLGISVRRTVKVTWIECAGKMEGAFRRLEFSPRAAKSLCWRIVDWGRVSVP